MRIDVIQAAVPNNGKIDKVRREAIEKAAMPETRIVIRIPEGQPTSIASAYENVIAIPGVLAEAQAAESEGADAVVINCTADTGIEVAREILSIPVVAVSEGAFHLAAQLSERFSVLTFAERIAPRFRAMASKWGMADRLRSVRSVEIPLREMDNTSALATALARKAKRCVDDDDAHLIILGCTEFEMAASATADLLGSEGVHVPLLKPFEIGLRQAESLIAMGLTQSPLSYPRPQN